MQKMADLRPPMPKYKPPPLPEAEDWTSGHERARSRSPSPFLRRSNAGKIRLGNTFHARIRTSILCKNFARRGKALNHAFSKKLDINLKIGMVRA